MERPRNRPLDLLAASTALASLLLAGCPAASAGTERAGAPRPVSASAVTQPPAVTEPQASCTARRAAELPALLSQLGCFEGNDPRWPSAALIGFSPNAPLFTDGADKERFFALPAGARIELDEGGDFLLPAGTVMIKTFSLHGVRVETRVLMHHALEGWHGASYRWNARGDDAELVALEGAELERAAGSEQTWSFPARAACNGCHGADQHVALGLEVAQLNGDFVDPHSGAGGNQLDRLIAAGLLDGAHPTLADPAARPRLAPYHDEREPLEARARSYLHANCASCHTDPASICTGDLRARASLLETGVCDAPAKIGDPSFPADVRVLAPGDAERSAIVHRMRAPGGSALAMPPVGRNVIDEAGLALISEWIDQMRACEP